MAHLLKTDPTGTGKSYSAPDGFQEASRPRTALIVEAPASNSTRLRSLLSRAGLRPVTTSAGRLAPSLVKRTRPDLVVLPPETGPPGASEIARLIKEDAATRHVPVILLVGSGRLDEIFGRPYPTEACLSVEAADDELVCTFRALVPGSSSLRYGPKPRAPLEGSLENDAFPDVLQFLFTTRKTGRISVEDGRRRGYIFIDDGHVVHAELVEHRGAGAFREMCFLSSGRFWFEPQVKTPSPSMCVEGLELLLETARRKDVADRSRSSSDEGSQVVADRRKESASSRPHRAGRSSSPRSSAHLSALLATGLLLIGGVSLIVGTGTSVEEAVRVEVQSEPPGARVFVDEREIGRTPIEELSVLPGNRLFRLSLEGRESVVELVRLDKGATPSVLRFTLPEEAPPRATLKLQNLPAHVKVYIDGERQQGGSAELEPGTHRVEVEAAGFARWMEQIHLEPAASKVIEVLLKPSEPGNEPSQSNR